MSSFSGGIFLLQTIIVLYAMKQLLILYRTVSNTGCSSSLTNLRQSEFPVILLLLMTLQTIAFLNAAVKEAICACLRIKFLTRMSTLSLITQPVTGGERNGLLLRITHYVLSNVTYSCDPLVTGAENRKCLWVGFVMALTLLSVFFLVWFILLCIPYPSCGR